MIENVKKEINMSCNYSCSHLSTVTDIPISIITKILDTNTVCADCDYGGPTLWICMHKACLKIGCAEDYNDHSTLHNRANPNHSIHMNLKTKRLWCYQCEREVFMDPTPTTTPNESDQDTKDGTTKSRDSGRGSYSTIRTETPERNNVYGFELNVGLNVGMSGDTSESSDADESAELRLDKPQGLVGLQNIGNTCYMNAALQALSNTIPLTKFFLDCSAIIQIVTEDRKPCLSKTYQVLMRDIWIKKNGGYVTPSGILYGIRHVHAMFRGYHQHDTQEFLRNFMDQLHEELKQVSPPEHSSSADTDTFSMAMEEPAISSSYESSEGEYETCDSGVSERSSLSDDTERPSNTAKRRLSRSASPGFKLRGARGQSSAVVDSQPSTSSSNMSSTRKPTKYRSIISDIFDGKLLSSVQCLTCNRISSRIETFQDLSLPIPSRDHLLVLHGRGANPGATCSEAVIPVQDSWMSWIFAWLRSWFYGPTVTLHDCLAAFFSTDELKGDNMYSCERCNKLRNGIKFSKVLQLPEVLCIHLKRFRHELMFSSKISSAVSFPLRGLEMRPYLHKDCVSHATSYELFSVICHHGTAGGGHYTCYSLNSGQWYEFDDQFVTEVSPEAVQACEAYVLFYRKVISNMDEVKNKVEELSDVCGDANEEDLIYISKQWMNQFYTFAEPRPIDNSDFLCIHGALNPDRAPALEQLAVLLPRLVYEYLQTTFGGCPAIPSLHICPACQAIQKRIAVEMDTLRKILDADEMPPTHVLSTVWYTQWHSFVKKRSPDPPGPIDNSKYTPMQLQSSDYTEVSEDVWNFFHGIYGGGPEIRIRSKPKLEVKEAPEFVIPAMKKQEKTENVDKSIYSHGEPMETNESNGDEVAMEVCNNKHEVNKVVAINSNNSDSNLSASSSTVNDETVVEVSNENTAECAKRRRRRYRDRY